MMKNCSQVFVKILKNVRVLLGFEERSGEAADRAVEFGYLRCKNVAYSFVCSSISPS